MIKWMLIAISWFVWSSVWATTYYTQHSVGWHWYDDPQEEKEKKYIPITTKENNPISQINEIRKTIKQALDQAILEPTPKNVSAYMVLENQLSNRANQFADTRQRLLLTHPELNYSLQHPTNGTALQVYHEQESKEQEKALIAFANHTGLFFFYKSTCPYCQRFAPILKNFSERYHMTILPITLDGIALPEFPDSRKDQGQAKQFHVTVEPSLFAVDPYTQKAYPIAYGLTSETELRDNIYKIITHESGGQL